MAGAQHGGSSSHKLNVSLVAAANKTALNNICSAGTWKCFGSNCLASRIGEALNAEWQWVVQTLRG
eukprot:10245798-Karenia_brevis.AAC.1